MKRWNVLTAMLALGLLISGCGGGNYNKEYQPPASLGELSYSISVEPNSTISLNDIEGRLISVDDALNTRHTSALPSGFIGRQGMLFTPQSPPGAGFFGRLSVCITMGNPVAGEYSDVLLYLFYIDPVTQDATMINTGRGDANNYVSFNINVLGYFVIAENSAVDRPGGFSVSAYADLANAPTGTTINFWAVAFSGSQPYNFTWDFGDGTQASGAEVSHFYETAGSYNVILSATDAVGRKAPAISTPIEINTGTQEQLSIQEIDVIQDPNSHLNFNYAVTLDGGTGPFTYHWTFDEDDVGNAIDGTAAQEHTFIVEGLFFGNVLVEDSTGATVTANFISDARQLTVTANPAIGSVPLTVEFTVLDYGFSSDDQLSIDFDDDDQSIIENDIVNHTYYSDGIYSVSVSSTRTIGDEAYPFESNTVVITVLTSENTPFIQLSQPNLPEPVVPFDIVGYNFGEASDTKDIRMDGVILNTISWSDNIVQVTIPFGSPATGGETALYIDGIAVSNSIDIQLKEAINHTHIQNVIPPNTIPNSRVLIIGNSFPNNATVVIDGQPAMVEYINANGIVALLPGGLTEGSHDLFVHTGGPSYSFPIAISSELFGDAPLLESITPSLQEIGQGNVVLTGTRLGTMNTAIVYAEGYALPRSNHNSGTITLSDPGPNIDSWVCVINRNNTSNALPLSYMRRPQILQLNPEEAAIGENVVITGSDFGTQSVGDNVLIDGQVVLPVQDWSDTQITFTVPEAATNGFITIDKKLESNAVYFVVLPDTPDTPDSGQL